LFKFSSSTSLAYLQFACLRSYPQPVVGPPLSSTVPRGSSSSIPIISPSFPSPRQYLALAIRHQRHLPCKTKPHESPSRKNPYNCTKKSRRVFWELLDRNLGYWGKVRGIIRLRGISLAAPRERGKERGFALERRFAHRDRD